MKSVILILAISLVAPHAFANTLVSSETVKRQKKLTNLFRLKNHIPVVYREVPNSDIINIRVTFKTGSKDLPATKRALNRLLFAALPAAATSYPKEKVFQMTARYALKLNCTGGIETSSCSLDTVNDYWNHALPLFAAIVKTPSLQKADIDLKRNNLLAEAKSQMADPGAYVNDVVNSVYYPKDHPYALSSQQVLEQLPNMTQSQLKTRHAKILSAKNLIITVAGSLSAKRLVRQLNKQFGSLPANAVASSKVPQPKFQEQASFAFENREIPTAYIRAKFNGLGIDDKNAYVTKLLIKVLDEELSEEIRTRRSLSYSVYAYNIQLSAGILMIGASTSKPQETLEAIHKVVATIKKREYTRRELEEHKRIFATSYFLKQEEHASLVRDIARSYLYHGSTDTLYEMPLRLAKVSPQDIKRLANDLLVNFRVGVVFNRKKFKDKWAKEFIKKSTGKS